METKQAILPLSAPVSISMLLCFGNRHNHITVCDETYFYFIDDIVPASYASGYPFCQKRLVGALPNPLLIAEVPSAAARFANAFSGPRRLPYVWSRAGLVRKTKRKEPGLEVSFPLNPALHRLYRSIAQNIQLFLMHYSCCFSFMSLRIVVLAAFNKSVSIRIS